MDSVRTEIDEVMLRKKNVLIAAGEIINQIAMAQQRMRPAVEVYLRRPQLGLRIERPNGFVVTAKPGWSGSLKEVKWNCTQIELLQDRKMLSMIIGEDQARLTRYFRNDWKTHLEIVYSALFKLVVDPNSLLSEHYDRCMCCGKKLTDISSRLRGIGPECIKYVGDIEEMSANLCKKFGIRTIDDEWFGGSGISQ